MIRALSLALALAACGPYHRAVATVTPGVPPVADCTEGVSRCNGEHVEVCALSDGVTRWLPVSVEACLHGCLATTVTTARCRTASEVTP